MVDITPFRGLIYNEEAIGDIANVVSPPYDVVTEKRRAEILSCSRFNILNLILPQGEGDRKYKNASLILNDWLDKKILIPDGIECFYIFEIGFRVNGVPKKMTGFIGLARIEPYSSGKILRHEKTLSGPTEDRYKLLENCRTNFGLIYTIYKPHTGITGILDNRSRELPFINIRPCYNRGLSFRVWRISKKVEINIIKEAMREKPLLIADGHHRYETSLLYKNRYGNDNVLIKTSDFVLTLFMDSGQEELKIYPTHRIIDFAGTSGLRPFLSAAAIKYDITPVSINDVSDVTGILDGFKKENNTGFIFYMKDQAFVLALKSLHSASRLDGPDVFILHDDIIKDLENTFKEVKISFSHKVGDIIGDIRDGIHDLGIFLNPPTVSDMEKICYSGGLLPQKSTYFWPKPCTGLVMYRL